MRRPAAAVALAIALVSAGCTSPEEAAEPTPQPTPHIDPEAIASAVLTLEDVGEGFEREEDPAPTTVQIGGQVGPAGYGQAEAEATSSFAEIEGTGFVTNTVYLLDAVEVAQAFMLAHRQAETESWTQERADGGSATFVHVGLVEDLVGLGEELYTARLQATITGPDGEETERDIEYVAYRIDRLVSFVVTQDLEAGEIVRRQEQRMVRIIDE